MKLPSNVRRTILITKNRELMMSVEQLSYACRIVTQGLGNAGIFWVPTILLAVSCLYFGARLVKDRGMRLMKVGDFLSLLTPSVVSIALVLWGTLLVWPHSADTTAPSWRVWGVLGLLVVHGAACVFVWSRSIGYRAFALSVVSIQFWIALCLASVVAMSVTANWV